MVILRTAHLMGSQYEIDQHIAAASAAGLGPHEIAALTTDSHSATGDFSDIEREIVRLTTHLLATRHATAATLDVVHTALGAEATIEMLMVIGRWAGLALMLNALEFDLDETARLAIPNR